MASIFSITERNEDSEITTVNNGNNQRKSTFSLLDSLLKADNEEVLLNQLNRLSLLSQNYLQSGSSDQRFNSINQVSPEALVPPDRLALAQEERQCRDRRDQQANEEEYGDGKEERDAEGL